LLPRLGKASCNHFLHTGATVRERVPSRIDASSEDSQDRILGLYQLSYCTVPTVPHQGQEKAPHGDTGALAHIPNCQKRRKDRLMLQLEKHDGQNPPCLRYFKEGLKHACRDGRRAEYEQPEGPGDQGSQDIKHMKAEQE
jgi:hypothetical protein